MDRSVNGHYDRPDGWIDHLMGIMVEQRSVNGHYDRPEGWTCQLLDIMTDQRDRQVNYWTL